MIKEIKLQHKMAQGMYEHRMFEVSDFTLVNKEGEEFPLSEFLEKVEKMYDHYVKLIELEKQANNIREDDPFDRSGAV